MAGRRSQRAEREVAGGGDRSLSEDRFIPSRSGITEAQTAFLTTFADTYYTSTCSSERRKSAPPSLQAEHAKAIRQELEGNNSNVKNPSNGSTISNNKSSKVLTYRAKTNVNLKGRRASASDATQTNPLSVLNGQQLRASCRSLAASPCFRQISSSPAQVLDAPDLLDDYYLNLLSWGEHDVIAIALAKTVYLWNAADGTITELMNVGRATGGGEGDYVSSLKWVNGGMGSGATGSSRSAARSSSGDRSSIDESNLPRHNGYLAIGTSSAETQLWDCQQLKHVRTMRGHSSRVSSLSWNGNILTTGSRDSTIVHHDVRMREDVVNTLRGHTQEVCGLCWSPDGQLLASGGNDNVLNLWDMVTTSRPLSNSNSNNNSNSSSNNRNRMQQQPTVRLTSHIAAVKALAWCPFHRHVLASGGGTADRCIKLWNVNAAIASGGGGGGGNAMGESAGGMRSARGYHAGGGSGGGDDDDDGGGALITSIDTESQVCSLLWSKTEKELVSSHGFMHNQLTVWSYPSMSKLKELPGHTSRVLHTAMSPDGSTVVSAGDETLRFWKIFSSTVAKNKRSGGGSNGKGRGSAAAYLSAGSSYLDADSDLLEDNFVPGAGLKNSGSTMMMNIR